MAKFKLKYKFAKGAQSIKIVEFTKMSVSLQIEKLGDNNYNMWRMVMRSVLITSDLWDIVSGKLKRPTDSTDSAVWYNIDQKALASIILNIKPSQLMHIKSCRTSSEAWL